jgi:hypothetical protein
MPILFAVVSLFLAARFFLRHPLLTILASSVVFYVFYVLMPADDPSAARFGNLDPTQELDSPTLVPVSRALLVAEAGRRATGAAGTLTRRAARAEATRVLCSAWASNSSLADGR